MTVEAQIDAQTDLGAQDCPMNAEPQPQHRWLLKLVGDWTYESEAQMGPDQPPTKSAGRQSTRAVGELWIMGEGRGDMPDGEPMHTVITLGYDPAKQQFVGTFIGSMMTWLWPYSGTLDDSGKVLTLASEGPSFTDPAQMSPYQDVLEVVDDDHHILRSRMPGPDGDWVEFMTAHYRRV